MMKVTREQVAEILNFDLVAMHSGVKVDPPVMTAKDVTAAARGAYGEIMLIGLTGAKLYRYKDKSGMPAFCIVGYSASGKDVSDLAVLIGV